METRPQDNDQFELATIKNIQPLSRENLTILDIETLKRDINDIIKTYQKTYDTLLYRLINPPDIEAIHSLQNKMQSIGQGDKHNFENFCSLLFFIQNLELSDEKLREDFTNLLINTLKRIKESNWDENIDPQIQLNGAFDSLSHSIFFEPQQNPEFYAKWRLKGSYKDYPYWFKLVSNLEYYFDNNYFKKLEIEWTQKFGFQKQSDVVNADDRIYDQFLFQTIEANEDMQIEVTSIDEIRPEIDIWTLENLILICCDYIKAFSNSHNPVEIADKAKAIREQFLTPFTRHFLNEVRTRCGRSEYEDHTMHLYFRKFYAYLHEWGARGYVNGLFKELYPSMDIQPSTINSEEEMTSADQPGAEKESSSNISEDTSKDHSGKEKETSMLSPFSHNRFRFQYATEGQQSSPKLNHTRESTPEYAFKNKK